MILPRKKKPTASQPGFTIGSDNQDLSLNYSVGTDVKAEAGLVPSSDGIGSLEPSPAKNQQTIKGKAGSDKRTRKTPEEKGLPSDKDLYKLAETYLKHQLQLWPELAKDGTLPSLNHDTVAQLAAEFKNRFIQATRQIFDPTTTINVWSALAAIYLRYSCDNSNPRSLDQQLFNALVRAKNENLFVPPEYIYFDAAVTGTTALRHGYIMAKDAMLNDPNVKALIVDDLSRASRDMVDTVKLGKLVEKLGKRLIGASDGMDTNHPMWKQLISMLGSHQEWFIDQLRTKVNRGMDYAFRAGTNTGLAGFGYILVPHVDAQGQPVFAADGAPLRALAINQKFVKKILALFRLYGVRKRNLDPLARLFNQHKVGGRTTWDARRIRILLMQWKFVGIDVRGMTYREKDDEGKYVIKYRPRSEWKVRRSRHLQIVPRHLWKLVQKRLNLRSRANPKTSRSTEILTDHYKKLLFRPLCGVCNTPLTYGHSGTCPSLTCSNGKFDKNGCTFKGYKAVSILEKAVVDHLRKQILTPARLKALLEAANAFVVAEAKKPDHTGRNIKLLEKEIKATTAKRDRLVDLIEIGDAGDEAGLDGVRARLANHEKTLVQLRRDRGALKSKPVEIPQPLKHFDIDKMLSDLRNLLRANLEASAPVIRELIGPIVVHQVFEPGKKKPTWIAKFNVNFVPAMVRLSASQKVPITRTQEYPNTGGWKKPNNGEAGYKKVDFWEYLQTCGRVFSCDDAEVWIVKKQKYELLASNPEFKTLLAVGASRNRIHKEMDVTYQLVSNAIDFLAAGRKPQAKPPGKCRKKGIQKRVPGYILHAAEVMRLKEKFNLNFPEIAMKLKLSLLMVERAYWHHRRTPMPGS